MRLDPESNPKIQLKQIIGIRTDLEMSKGKMVAQGAHASVLAYIEAVVLDHDMVTEWWKSGYKKIALKIPREETFWNIVKQANEKSLPVGIQVDWGLTQIAPDTPTAFAIGPIYNYLLDELTGDLKLL